jgi:hypothetical protein
MTVSGHVISALVEGKSSSIAAAIQSETGARIDIVRDPAGVKAAEAAAALSAAPAAAASTEDDTATAEASAAATAPRKGKGPHFIAGVGQLLLGVGGTVTVSGTDAAVLAAEARIREVIAAHQERSLRLPSVSIIGEILGKGGATAKVFKAGGKMRGRRGRGDLRPCEHPR